MQDSIKGNPLLIRRGKREKIEGVMHDWNQPEGAQFYPLKLYRLTGSECIRAQSLWDELLEIYVVNGRPLPPVDDQPVIVSSGACQLAAYLFVAQQDPDPKAGGWTVEQLLQMMVSDTLLIQMQQVFTAIMPKPMESQTDDSGQPKEGLVFIDPLASGGARSSALAPETSSDIPNS